MKSVSKATPMKQKKIKELFKQHLIICNVIQKKYKNVTYVYLDGTSYKGFYCDELGKEIMGSPILFLEAVKEIKPLFKIKCFFIEKKPEFLNILRNNIYGRNLVGTTKMEFICGEYGDEIPKILDGIEQSFGLIYIDPDGIFNDDELEKICDMENTSKIDLIINCNATSIKRTKSVFDAEDLKTRQSKIHKKNWFISEPHVENDPWGWCFLYGVNSDCFIPSGLYRVNSERGKYLFSKANYTKVEYRSHLPNQPSLFDF